MYKSTFKQLFWYECGIETQTVLKLNIRYINFVFFVQIVDWRKLNSSHFKLTGSTLRAGTVYVGVFADK